MTEPETGPEKIDQTRERILDEAEKLFAEKGYHAVSVREITTEAACNLAAVNYHFGNKQNLYHEVFRSRWIPRARTLFGVFRESLASRKAPTQAEVVQALSEAFLRGPMTGEERQRHSQLMIRELSQPTEAFDIVVEEAVAPVMGTLTEQLKRSQPKRRVPQEEMTLNVLSIFAMTIYFNFSRPLVSRMTGCEYDDAFTARLVRHITRFSLHGMNPNRKER